MDCIFFRIISQIICIFLIVIMIRTISQRLSYPFCVKNKTQNFFEMNPVFPDFGEKDFDLYNSERKKVNVLDEFSKCEMRNKNMRELVRKRIYLKKYDRFKTYTGGKFNRLDDETYLPIGIDSRFDAFIQKFKKKKLVGSKDRNELRRLILKLVHQFKCKSEVQLIKIFRVSLANMKKDNLLDKMRGMIMEKALLRTSTLMKNYRQIGQKETSYAEELEEEEFEKALKEIDQKIAKVQNNLRFDEHGLPKKMSDYDPDYGWKQEHQIEENQDFDFTLKLGRYEKIKTSSTPMDDRSLQDWSIRTRINRLYFLRRLELIKQEKDEHLAFHQELPLNLKKRQNIMNDLANRYKEEELIQEPDINDIYREIDVFLDKVYVKIQPGRKDMDTDSSQQVYDESLPKQDYLWESLDVQEVVCSSMYNPDTIKEISLSDELISSVSYSPHTEISLNRLPVNLYRHSQLESFGVFNDYRHKLGKNFLHADEVDFQPTFNQFTVEKASNQYQKVKRTTSENIDQSAYGKAKRKTAEAEVYLKKGTGKITINGKLLQDYFGDPMYRVDTLKPFVFTDTSGLYDADFNVAGSGQAAQANCMAYALTRALIKVNPNHKSILSKFGFVGFDARQKERKKTNLYSARVRPPYVRR